MERTTADAPLRGGARREDDAFGVAAGAPVESEGPTTGAGGVGYASPTGPPTTETSASPDGAPRRSSRRSGENVAVIAVIAIVSILGAAALGVMVLQKLEADKLGADETGASPASDTDGNLLLSMLPSDPGGFDSVSVRFSGVWLSDDKSIWRLAGSPEEAVFKRGGTEPMPVGEFSGKRGSYSSIVLGLDSVQGSKGGSVIDFALPHKAIQIVVGVALAESRAELLLKFDLAASIGIRGGLYAFDPVVSEARSSGEDSDADGTSDAFDETPHGEGGAAAAPVQVPLDSTPEDTESGTGGSEAPSTEPERQAVQMYISDDIVDEFDGFTVTISRIELQSGDRSVLIFNGAKSVDLLALHKRGTAALVASSQVPAGAYPSAAITFSDVVGSKAGLNHKITFDQAKATVPVDIAKTPGQAQSKVLVVDLAKSVARSGAGYVFVPYFGKTLDIVPQGSSSAGTTAGTGGPGPGKVTSPTANKTGTGGPGTGNTTGDNGTRTNKTDTSTGNGTNQTQPPSGALPLNTTTTLQNASSTVSNTTSGVSNATSATSNTTGSTIGGATNATTSTTSNATGAANSTASTGTSLIDAAAEVVISVVEETTMSVTTTVSGTSNQTTNATANQTAGATSTVKETTNATSAEIATVETVTSAPSTGVSTSLGAAASRLS